MENYFRPDHSKHFFKFFKVPDVGDIIVQTPCNLCSFKEAGFCRRSQSISCHISSHFREPHTEPGALESGMPGYQNAFAAPELLHHPKRRNGETGNRRNTKIIFHWASTTLKVRLSFSQVGLKSFHIR